MLGLFLCRGLRVLERCLPPWCLQLLFWPAAAVLACWQLAWGKPRVRHFERLPLSLRPPLARPAWIWRLWQQRTAVNLAKLLCLWPDRLGQPAWHKHCRCIGMEQIEETWARGRPVVLAALHFGPQSVLRFWMRARGLPIAVLLWKKSTSRPRYRRYLDALCDQVSGLAGIRHVFGRDEIREAIQLLQSGRLLAIALEGHDARHGVLVKGDDFDFRMATGALRLAARAKADVIPCLIRAEPFLGFTAHFGKRVPTEWVADPGRHEAACNHLWHELLPVLREQPGQAGYELLECFQPVASRPDRQAAGEGSEERSDGCIDRQGNAHRRHRDGSDLRRGR